MPLTGPPYDHHVRNSAEATTCLIAGGGPAGMMLGLLLARGGLDVTVMEKHQDFLRDFRGDTVHASTLRLLDDLGLGHDFDQLVHREIETIGMQVQGVAVDIDLRRIPGPHKHIALVPQWDFLEMLATAAEKEPSFRLMRSTEVLEPIRERGNAIVGVRYRGSDGEVAEMRADLTVACDGRGSALRMAMGLQPQTFGTPMDVWWFRLPRAQQDPPGLEGVMASGHAMIVIDRGDYYQCAYIIPKGSDSRLRAQGIESLQRTIAALVPRLAERVHELTSFDEVKLLDVQLNRLHRWYADGLLLIGDAAHAMSPVGGVGINLAIADAVATARIVARPLRAGRVPVRDLARIQARRWIPTALIQGMQRVIHAKVIAHAVAGDGSHQAPVGLRLVSRLKFLRSVAGYAVAIGPLPERAPRYARRANPAGGNVSHE